MKDRFIRGPRPTLRSLSESLNSPCIHPGIAYFALDWDGVRFLRTRLRTRTDSGEGLTPRKNFVSRET